MNDERNIRKKQLIIEKAPDCLRNAVQAASEKGASNWVTTMPTHDHNTILHKQDFVDAVYIRYGWALQNLPARCSYEKANFSLQHALDCPLGGLRTVQHNGTRHYSETHARRGAYVCRVQAQAAAFNRQNIRAKNDQ